ncbi:DNA repair protein RadC [Peribacillus frigoritolerans]|nr:DNA repair protein RadC [Peribacillus frigoritolerans]
MSEKMLIRDYPKEERPRERFLQDGPQSLSNQELLALLLRTGSREESVLQLSGRLINFFKGLRLLKEASVEELTVIKGIGEAKAIQILASVELGRRINNLNDQDRYVIRFPEDGANYCMEEMRFFITGTFRLSLFKYEKIKCFKKTTVFIGSLNASIVHPREVFKEAFKRSAASIICLHNHPSGDPSPSREDIEVTKRLVKCGKIIGIEVLDHIIIGEHKYVSLKEKGYL